jgi:hypothetical protein
MDATPARAGAGLFSTNKETQMEAYIAKKRAASEWIKYRSEVSEDSIWSMNRSIAREAGGNEPVSTSHCIALLFPVPTDGCYDLGDLAWGVEDAGEEIVKRSILEECTDDICAMTVSINGDEISIAKGKLCVIAEVDLTTVAAQPQEA